jgi:hypothetical protein
VTVRLRVEVRGLDRVERGLANAPNTLEDQTRSAMTASLLLLEADQRRMVAQDTKRLLGSINHKITGRGANLTGRVGPSARYGYYVEYGRRAGKPPPVSAVAGWARRHGANPFLVARGIGRHGTKPQPFVRPSYTRNVRRIATLFGRIGQRVAQTIVGGR